MNELMLIKSTEYNGAALDCYIKPEQEDKGDFWATREQIGQLLGYENPRDAIAHIHLRNKERLDKFSGVFKLSTPEGGTQNVIVYSFKGLLEICRYSHKPKANAVMDWLWQVADEIRRTGSYSLKKESEAVPQGMFEAAKEIALKALACKEDKDFIEVLALDKVFSNLYGKSALELSDLSIYELTEYVFADDADDFDPPACKYDTYFVLKNKLQWEKRECLANPYRR